MRKCEKFVFSVELFCPWHGQFCISYCVYFQVLPLLVIAKYRSILTTDMKIMFSCFIGRNTELLFACPTADFLPDSRG